MFGAIGVSGKAGDDPLSLPWNEIISSPLKRCADFARHLSGLNGMPHQINAGFREIDYGDWEGMPLPQWRQTAAVQFRKFRKDMTALAPPNGEKFTDFRDRVLHAWQSVIESNEGDHLLLITHGGVMRVLLPTVLGLPLNRTGVLEIPFACISRVEIRQGKTGPIYSLLSHNSLPHSED